MGAVLLVEDDALIRIDLTAALRDEGYDVVAASDGRDACDQLQTRNRWCLILLDLKMPRMSAAEFRRRQLEDPDLAAIPIVLISAADGLRDHARALGADGFIAKPFRLEQLFAVVQRHCTPEKVGETA
jgi:CheY-like chemotaxis protein